MVALNANLETNNGSECQTKDAALNAKLNNVAMNAKTKKIMAPNAKPGI